MPRKKKREFIVKFGYMQCHWCKGKVQVLQYDKDGEPFDMDEEALHIAANKHWENCTQEKPNFKDKEAFYE